jgi:hypothetical protein
VAGCVARGFLFLFIFDAFHLCANRVIFHFVHRRRVQQILHFVADSDPKLAFESTGVGKKLELAPDAALIFTTQLSRALTKQGITF